jgi:hypothetical protein
MKGTYIMSLILIDNPAQPAQSATREATLKQKLEAVRTSLRLIGRDIQATEGRLLDFSTAETIARSLHHITRQLDAIAVAVAVLERKEGAR